MERMYHNVTDPSTCNFNFCEENQQHKIHGEKSAENLTNNDSPVLPVTAAKTTTNNADITIGTTTEKSNAIIKEIPTDHDIKRNKILHRIVSSVSFSPVTNKSPEIRATENYVKEAYSRNIILKGANSGTYKPKNNWPEREMNLTWLFVSIAVCLVVLVLCSFYTSSKATNITRSGYERMGPVPMSDFRD